MQDLSIRREDLVVLGQFYRDCGKASESSEIKKLIRRMTDLELGALGVFLLYVNQLAEDVISNVPVNIEQGAFDFIA